ncbi:hypothetical protein BBJ28_00001959 [Nothophytophthora sp. Chile5]|nr:hypothetical protein BBJ28_00001959 [Nothophytophthora sp. Chile5]
MRGPSKVVGGGQFRAASVSNASPVSVGPVMSSAMCAKCASVRAGALKARHQTAQAQATTLELQQYVAKVEEMQHTLWKERSTQQAEIAYLQSVLARRDEEFFMTQTNHTLLERQLRALQVGKEATGPVKSSNNRESYELLDDTTQSSSSLVPESSSDFEKQLETALADLQAAREVGRVAKEQCALEARLRLEERVMYEIQISELRQSSRECLETTTLELQQKQQKELQLIQETNQQLHQDIQTKVAATEVLEQQHKNAALAQQNRMRASQVQLNDKEAELTRLLAKLEILASDHAAAIASNEVLSKQINSLEFQIQKLTQDKLQTAVTLQQLQKEGDFRAEQERADRNRLQESELRCLAESLDAEKQHTRLLRSQLSGAEAELADHANLLLKQQRSHVQALDRTLQSTVRLCVVAPTVNVHLTTKGAQISGKNGCILPNKMLGKTQDAVDAAPVVCRSTPAQENIRHVMEKEVLPLFTSVFLQEDEGASPQTGVPMTFWLQELLCSMQTRIASQLESIYSSATESSE